MMTGPDFITSGPEFHDVRSRFFFLFLVLLKETRMGESIRFNFLLFGINEEK